MVQPTALHVPKTSFAVPLNSFAKLFERICRTTLKNCAWDTPPISAVPADPQNDGV